MKKNIKQEILQNRLFSKFNKKDLDILQEELENYLGKNKKNLKKTDLELIVSDLDDTIFCVNKRFEVFPELKQKRGQEGNKHILENIGIENFIEKLYKNKDFPKDIISKFCKKDLILTAGDKEIQKAKLEVLGLKNFNVIIVENSKDKILALLKYLFENIKEIPKKIIIYEDRPEFFIYFEDFFQKKLGIKLEIIYVKMESNNKAPEQIKL